MLQEEMQESNLNPLNFWELTNNFFSNQMEAA